MHKRITRKRVKRLTNTVNGYIINTEHVIGYKM